jgi:chromosome segregation ATPase
MQRPFHNTVSMVPPGQRALAKRERILNQREKDFQMRLDGERQISAELRRQLYVEKTNKESCQREIELLREQTATLLNQRTRAEERATNIQYDCDRLRAELRAVATLCQAIAGPESTTIAGTPFIFSAGAQK